MEKLHITTRYMILLDKLCPRYGYVLRQGRWVKEWPSGKQWQIDQCGQWCRIVDEHGRLIRNMSDGLTVSGMLARSK